MTVKRIALLGDFDETVVAHAAIPMALELASSAIDTRIEWVWVASDGLEDGVDRVIDGFDGVWCVPASPYRSMDGALSAIRRARETGIPFLGTCGGYQHAVLEFARNVLGHAYADNAEVNPDAAMAIIGPLSCALVEQSGDISLASGSRIAVLQGTTRVTEKYHCSYGVAPEYVALFDGSDLVFTGHDDNGEPRAFELTSHPFFVGTAYQPERAALSGERHPLVDGFVAAVVC